jgi:sugar phosphate permease
MAPANRPDLIVDRPRRQGVRTAPRDALVADSIRPEQRGLAFGLHRAADTGGAVAGLAVALLVLGWRGFDASAPFLFGGVMALPASILMAVAVTGRWSVTC